MKRYDKLFLKYGPFNVESALPLTSSLESADQHIM